MAAKFKRCFARAKHLCRHDGVFGGGGLQEAGAGQGVGDAAGDDVAVDHRRPSEVVAGAHDDHVVAAGGEADDAAAVHQVGGGQHLGAVADRRHHLAAPAPRRHSSTGEPSSRPRSASGTTG